MALFQSATREARQSELQYLIDNYRQFYWDGPNGAEPTVNILKKRLVALDSGEGEE